MGGSRTKGDRSITRQQDGWTGPERIYVTELRDVIEIEIENFRNYMTSCCFRIRTPKLLELHSGEAKCDVTKRQRMTSKVKRYLNRNMRAARKENITEYHD